MHGINQTIEMNNNAYLVEQLIRDSVVEDDDIVLIDELKAQFKVGI